MSWVSIAKPTTASWVSLNPQGKEQYDQATLTYDDASTFYDGINPSLWTGVTKPTTASWVTIAKP